MGTFRQKGRLRPQVRRQTRESSQGLGLLGEMEGQESLLQAEKALGNQKSRKLLHALYTEPCFRAAEG